MSIVRYNPRWSEYDMLAIDKGIIARWKIDTPFENWLGKKADESHFFKKLYCAYYRIFDRKYYTKGIEMARAIFHKYQEEAGLDAKEEKEIIQDMIYSLHRFGFTYEEYFWMALHDLSAKGRGEHIPDKIRYEWYYQMNYEEIMHTFKDKGKTFQLLKQYFKRDCIAAYSENERDDFLQFVSRNTRFIYKPMYLQCGRGIQIIDTKNVDSNQLFSDLIKDGAFMAEELIQQSKEMSQLHSESVNTVRMITIRCKDGVHIFNPILRMGRGDTVVDNAGSGGILAYIDSDSGIVVSKGTEEGLGCYIFHPDTHVVIPGFQIPAWDEAVQLAKEVAMKIPDATYIGWDFAHTDNGWVIIEANGDGQFLETKECRGGRRKFEMLMKNI